MTVSLPKKPEKCKRGQEWCTKIFWQDFIARDIRR